jgi:site-specific recombinase XerD
VHRIGSNPGAGTLNRHNAWTAIRKRARNAGFLTPVGCHTWRATGVTVYLENGGRLEHAQQMAAHESRRTTKLYDRTKDEITIGLFQSNRDSSKTRSLGISLFRI